MKALVYNIKRGYSSAEIVAIQKAVGALETGEWDDRTIDAVKFWQQLEGLKTDGKVGPKTHAEMLGGATTIAFKVLHEIPESTTKWRYDHLPLVYRKPDPQWEAITAGGTFEAGLCRLVSGWKKGTFSRGPDSWISLDTYSIGIAHWWSDTAPEVLSQICVECPELAAWAWGEKISKLMVNPKWLEKVVPPKKGKMPHDSDLDWLLAGWYAIARHPQVIEVCVSEWFESYLHAGLRLMDYYRWWRADTLAALVRMTNSRGSNGMNILIDRALKIVGSSEDEEKVIETAFFRKDLYDHPERLELIRSWKEFEEGRPILLDPSSLNYDVKPQRVDGTIPPFVALGL